MFQMLTRSLELELVPQHPSSIPPNPVLTLLTPALYYPVMTYSLLAEGSSIFISKSCFSLKKKRNN